MGKINLQYSFPQHIGSRDSTAAIPSPVYLPVSTDKLSKTSDPVAIRVALGSDIAVQRIEHIDLQKYPKVSRKVPNHNLPFIPADEVAKRTGTHNQDLCS